MTTDLSCRLPLFSIITVCLNSQNCIAETIESVVKQDYHELEYLIVDGGSQDGTLEIIKKYAKSDQRIRWVSEADNGIADAFNKGIRMSQGDIVGILNADDAYLPGALQTVADAVQKDPESDVFHGDMLRLNGDEVLFRLTPASVENAIWHEMPINHPATFVTRRAYHKNGLFDASCKFAMDYDLMLRMYAGGSRFHYIPHTLAAMRYGGASDSRYIAGLLEVRCSAVRYGYPAWKAWCWFSYKVVITTVKNLVRCFGLTALLRMHPRFRSFTK